MATLNGNAAEAMKEAGASACTDVTGFGLFAHLRRMLRVSGLAADIFAEALPAFPGALEALRQGVIPGAVERHREYVGDSIRVAPDVDEALVNLGFDAQTSGGLLIAVPVERLELLRHSLARRNTGAFVIGKVTDHPGNGIFVRSGGVERFSASSTRDHSMKNPETEVAAHGEACCAEIFKSGAAQSSTAESQKAFGALLRSVQAGGTLNEKTKELILFSLVVSSRCQPCFSAHFRRARELGINQAELDEAAWCAIVMGGAPVKMFYQENLGKMLKADG
jgi:AhpD family alkylhydroperoxidase